MGAQGTDTIDFGATPSHRATKTVTTGVGSILTGSSVEAWIMNETSADHSDYEHQMVGMVLKLTCGSIVASTSFEVVGTSLIKLRGVWTFRWVWN